jgi:hypothetical protein
MANRRDGGRVIVGVVDEPPRLEPVGLDVAPLGTWTHDHLADAIGPYVDPRVEFSLQVLTLDAKAIVLIHVGDFVDQPVLCIRRAEHKDARGQVTEVPLRSGALYMRPHGKHETREPQTAAEMRQVLDLAVERGVIRFLGLAEAGGLGRSRAGQEADSERFREQAKDFR